MPLTPFHFGPHALVALPLKRWIDFPVFILANVIVDIEPLAVMVFGLNYPLHGYFHTFLIGGILGIAWGLLAWPFRTYIARFMALIRIDYSPSLITMMISGMLGVWLHVAFDALIYADMFPFWPFTGNPLAGFTTESWLYRFCAICFIPALLIFILLAAGRSEPNRK